VVAGSGIVRNDTTPAADFPLQARDVRAMMVVESVRDLR
jgi:hypothetical protein